MSVGVIAASIVAIIVGVGVDIVVAVGPISLNSLNENMRQLTCSAVILTIVVVAIIVVIAVVEIV